MLAPACSFYSSRGDHDDGTRSDRAGEHQRWGCVTSREWRGCVRAIGLPPRASRGVRPIPADYASLRQVGRGLLGFALQPTFTPLADSGDHPPPVDRTRIRRCDGSPLAEASGHAVQTIYSLVGPRDQAISEAISEYISYVGRTTEPRFDDPYAVMGITNGWVQSMEATPEFCRQVSLMFFTEARAVFYTFRDQQLSRMCSLLTKQQKCGVIRAEINVRDLGEQLVLLSTALCLEWSDRPFPLALLHRRLFSGYRSLLAGAVRPSLVCPGDGATDR